MLKVPLNSSPGAVIDALVGTIRERGKVELQAIGVSTVNQEIKIVAIARGCTAASWINLFGILVFVDAEINVEKRTAIKIFSNPQWVNIYS